MHVITSFTLNVNKCEFVPYKQCVERSFRELDISTGLEKALVADEEGNFTVNEEDASQSSCTLAAGVPVHAFTIECREQYTR